MIRALSTALALLVLLCGAPDARANPHLERGIRLLSQMEDEKALHELARALSWRGNTRETLARIHLYRGIAYSSLVHREGARQAFTKALELDPRIRLPDSVSPKIRRGFEQLRAEVVRRQRPTPRARRQDDADVDALFTTPRQRPRAGPDRRDSGDPRRDRGSPINWHAWVATGVAVGALAAGLGLGASVSSAEDEAKNSELTYGQANAILDRARGKALGANILFGVAGVAAGAAVYFFITRRAPERRASVTLLPVPGGAVATLGGVAI